MKKSKRIVTIFCLLFTMTLLSACGKDEALEEYKTKMETYFSSLASHSEAINAIDPYAMDASETLLSELDALQTEASEMATWEVPGQFDGVGDIAKMAAEDLIQAVSIYHQVYEADEYNPENEFLANQYYQRANKELQAILTVLHGEEISSDFMEEMNTEGFDTYKEDEFMEDEFIEDEFPEDEFSEENTEGDMSLEEGQENPDVEGSDEISQ